MKKKNNDTDRNKVEKEIMKVTFKNTYIGKYGTYYKGNIYTLSYDSYLILKNDCEEIEESNG